MGSTSASGVPGSERLVQDHDARRGRCRSRARPRRGSSRWTRRPRSFARLSFVPSGIDRAGRRDGDRLARRHVGRAAHDRATARLRRRRRCTRVRRSASGWRSADRTRPTRKCSSAVTPCVWMRSTSVPVIASRVGELLRGQARDRRSRGARRAAASSELLQEPEVVLEEQPQVAHAVLEEGPIDTAASPDAPAANKSQSIGRGPAPVTLIHAPSSAPTAHPATTSADQRLRAGVTTTDRHETRRHGRAPDDAGMEQDEAERRGQARRIERME